MPSSEVTSITDRIETRSTSFTTFSDTGARSIALGLAAVAHAIVYLADKRS